MTDHTPGEFTGKVVYITGAGGGIGRATALAFVEVGARVALVDVDDETNAETARLVRKNGGEALELHADISKEEDVRSSLATTVATFGALDIAFNNAGVEQQNTPTGELDVAYWDKVVNTDLRGVFLCIRHEVPLLQANGGGVIVNTSSGAGVIGIKGQAAYAAAKHAVVGLTRSVGLDYADSGIRVNAVAPGIIDTPMLDRSFAPGEEGRKLASAAEPIGRPGRPEEIASAVLWLSSEKAAFMVGHTLVMDGGQTIQ